MRTRTAALAVACFLSGSFLSASLAYSWTGPSAAPPNSNVNAPINVGSTDQTKNANLGVNGLAVFGNSLLQASAYLNWGATSGTNGYGIRDNAGTLEFKNSGGSWSSIQATVSGLLPTSQWTTSGANIYKANAGNVGIGVTSPNELVEVAAAAGGRMAITDGNGATRRALLFQAPTAGADYARLLAYNYGAAAGVNLLLQDSGGNVGIGTSPSHKLHVIGPASTGVHAIYGVTGINNNATYGVYGASGNGYYGGLGRGDGYSFVGNGILYNNGAAQATAFTYISDRRFKDNIRPLDQGLVTLLKLRPVSFTWTHGAPLAGQHDIGLIAQDVQKILPELVHKDNKGTLSIDYVRLTPFLIKAVQEQEAKIDALEAIVCKDHPEEALCRKK